MGRVSCAHHGRITRLSGPWKLTGAVWPADDCAWWLGPELGQFSAQLKRLPTNLAARPDREPALDGYPGASRSPMAATATRSRAMAAKFGSTVIKASACSRVTARYSASLRVSQSC